MNYGRHLCSWCLFRRRGMAKLSKISDDKINEFSHRIESLCRRGLVDGALKYLHLNDSCANAFSYQSILNCCLRMKALPQSKAVHAHMIMRGFIRDEFLVNTLIDLYSKCGSLDDACQLFENMRKKTVYSWTAMISAYSRFGQTHKALRLFQKLYEHQNLAPDGHLFSVVLGICAKLQGLEEGRRIHNQVMRRGFDKDIVVANSLLEMYAKCGRLDEARSLFDRISAASLVSWTSLIGGYSRKGCLDEALLVFRQMLQVSALKLDSRILVSVLSACRTVKDGMEVHREIVKHGVQSDQFVGTALIDMYGKFRRVEDARNVFDKMPQRSLLCWTAMIVGYVQNGFSIEALEVFRGMNAKGVKPDLKAFSSVLPACAELGDLQEGERIHHEIFSRGLGMNAVIASALVDMYAKCGEMGKARRIFDGFNEKDVVLWNTMISAYSRAGPYQEAMDLYHEMKKLSVQPSYVTFVNALSACAKLKALEQGLEVHEDVIRSGLGFNSLVEKALVNMHAKCGSVEGANFIFEQRKQQNMVSWNVIIGAYVLNGRAVDAVKALEQMLEAGFKPNHVTLSCILSACCHKSLTEKGEWAFQSVDDSNGPSSTIDHFSNVMYLLYHHGLTKEADDFTKKMKLNHEAKLKLPVECG